MDPITLVAGIVQLAPMLAKFFGAGETSQSVADKAASIARAVTGTSDNVSALAALSANPTLMLEYQNAILKQESDFEALYVSDKASARARDTEFIKAGTRNYRADFLLAISVIMVFVILSVVILKQDLNEYAKGSLTTILGLFLTQIGNIFNFEFGTTRKTDEKNDQILKDYIKK